MSTRATPAAMVSAFAAALAFASASASATSFRLTELKLGGTTSTGTEMNASGQATGFAETPDGAIHAFLWGGTTMQDLGTLGGALSQGNAINNAGQVTGVSQTTHGPPPRFPLGWHDNAGPRNLGRDV